MIMFNALTNGILQLRVPEEFRGRLMAFYSLVFIGLSQVIGSHWRPARWRRPLGCGVGRGGISTW
jgi:hypothetical protein